MACTAAACALLLDWISFLLPVIPSRSRLTFIELLCGCLLSQDGWMTRAISLITRKKHWTTYYKLIGRGSIKTQALANQLLRLVLRVFPGAIATLVIDDTLVPRCSTTAPGVAIRHDHSRKTNRPRYLNAQCWVTLALAVPRGVVPIRSRLVPLTGNTNKLSIARALVRVIVPLIPKARLLIDSWFMRGRLVLPLLARGVQIIGQARHDTALFLPPEPEPKRRGRPRRYGQKLSRDDIAALPATEHHLWLHGKLQHVRLRSTVAVARFLKATPVRAVWYEFFDPKQQRWSPPRSLLATEIILLPTDIMRLYALRFGIEPLFHNLKRWWGANHLWQQSRRGLELWMQIRSTGYALMHMLALSLPEAFPLADIAPWRTHRPLITAGLCATWLRQHFSGLPFYQAYDRKSAKFPFPQPRTNHALHPASSCVASIQASLPFLVPLFHRLCIGRGKGSV